LPYKGGSQRVNGRTVAVHYCTCNWGTCIAPPTRRPRAGRPRAHHWVNPYPSHGV